MNEKLFIVIALGVGFAAGMFYEHQRFLAEIQGMAKKHAATPAAPAPAAPAQ